MVKGKRTLVLLLPAMAAMALVALLLVASNVVASSHRREQAHHRSGAVGASAAWSSGWVSINPGETMTFTHNLGGNPDDYAVELWYQDAKSGGYGINHRGAGGLEAGGKYYGVHWQNLTDTTVQVVRRPDDTFADQVRVRIWIPDPPAWDSGWVDIAPGTLQTLTHNVGGNADDYT